MNKFTDGQTQHIPFRTTGHTANISSRQLGQKMVAHRNNPIAPTQYSLYTQRTFQVQSSHLNMTKGCLYTVPACPPLIRLPKENYRHVNKNTTVNTTVKTAKNTKVNINQSINQPIKYIYKALFTSADVTKCYTETQPKPPNSKQCRCSSTNTIVYKYTNTRVFRP